MVLENRQKLSFNNASEAKYIYISSGQKFIKITKIGWFGEFLKTWNVGQTVSVLIGQKMEKMLKLENSNETF